MESRKSLVEGPTSDGDPFQHLPCAKTLPKPQFIPHFIVNRTNSNGSLTVPSLVVIIHTLFLSGGLLVQVEFIHDGAGLVWSSARRRSQNLRGNVSFLCRTALLFEAPAGHQVAPLLPVVTSSKQCAVFGHPQVTFICTQPKKGALLRPFRFKHSQSPYHLQMAFKKLDRS